MKVLHLFEEINFSGAEVMYASAAAYFRQKGVDMIAVSTGKEKGNYVAVFEENKIPVYHYPIPRSAAFILQCLPYYLRFTRFLQTEKIEVVQIHRDDLYMAALCARLTGVRVIKTMHGVFKNRKITFPYAIFQRLAGRTLLKIQYQTVSRAVYQNELEQYRNPSVLIHNWYHAGRFYPAASAAEKQQVRNRLGMEQHTLVLISVGGCAAVKNHADIIKAIALLPDNISLLYVHVGSGDTETAEKNLAASLGVQHKIRFVGTTNKVRDYLITADVYLMPSQREGLSIACLEAMACGLPVIAYNVPGLRDMVFNNENGFLVEPDCKNLAAAIEEYKLHPGLAILHGSRAAQYASSHFSMQANVDKMIQLYRGETQADLISPNNQ